MDAAMRMDKSVKIRRQANRIRFVGRHVGKAPGHAGILLNVAEIYTNIKEAGKAKTRKATRIAISKAIEGGVNILMNEAVGKTGFFGAAASYSVSLAFDSYRAAEEGKETPIEMLAS